MYAIRPSSPSAKIFSGVSAILYSGSVALFTLLSVACAESTTDTKSVNGFCAFNSVAGAGFFFLKRRNTSVISSGVSLRNSL